MSAADLLPVALRRIRVMRSNGIVSPVRAFRAARRATLPLPIACAFLEQESSGGQNVFGHDDTIFVGAGKVTRRKYRRYKEQRDALLPDGERRMQGVGPMQLTWYTLQDDADERGGCHKPTKNMAVGFELVRVYLDNADDNIVDAGEEYNGARSYGHEVKEKVERWRQRLP
ncbi:MAG TPA: hypothetical protein VEX15_10640 [Nocardioidaceae bacterium]|nr:hypothetical protein [Nocardioidaceae bacterium]